MEVGFPVWTNPVSVGNGSKFRLPARLELIKIDLQLEPDISNLSKYGQVYGLTISILRLCVYFNRIDYWERVKSRITFKSV